MASSFSYSKDDTELKAYYAQLRKQHEAECANTGEKKPAACHELAEFYDHVDSDPERAIGLLSRLCHDQRFGRSCAYLGSMRLNGRGMIHRLGKKDEVLIDSAKALERFDFGCSKGFRNSCFYLSVMYLQGRNGVQQDMPKALQFAERACDLDHPWGCVNAARMYSVGDGVPKDEAKAEKLKEKARLLAQSQ